MVRKTVGGALTALCGMLVAGCCSGPNATTGVLFQILKPPTITGVPQVTAVTMGSQAGLVAIDHSTLLGDVRSPVMGDVRAPMAPMAPECGPGPAMDLTRRRFFTPRQGSPTIAERAPEGSCSWEDVCRLMHRIEQRLGTLPQAAPMPRETPEQE